MANENRRKAGTMIAFSPKSDRGIVKVGTAPADGISVSVRQSCGMRVISVILRSILSK